MLFLFDTRDEICSWLTEPPQSTVTNWVRQAAKPFRRLAADHQGEILFSVLFFRCGIGMVDFAVFLASVSPTFSRRKMLFDIP